MNTGETIALIKAFGNGGSSLPPVTPEDNGKVLAVKDGAWAAEENVLVVNLQSGTASEMFPQVKSAFLSGKTVIGTYGNSTPLICVSCAETNAQFVSVSNGSSDVRTAQLTSSSIFSNVKRLLPYVSSTYNGSEMVVKDGAWAVQKKKFIVTLTPTSPDYSGTMDKTVAEINAAFEAGQEIVFKLQTAASSYIEVPVQLVGHNTTFTYPSFETSVVQRANNIQVFAHTDVTNDGTKQTYSTTVYSLTPAS